MATVTSQLETLVEDLAALLGGPCVLEDADFNLITYAAQGEVDDVRRRTILERRASREIRDWFHGHGIRDAEQPVRTPADPDLGISPRLCVPARHQGRPYGYFWLIDPDQSVEESLWPDAMAIAETAGVLLSQAGRRQARVEAHLADLIGFDGADTRQAARGLAALTGLELDGPVRCLVVAGPERSLEVASRRARPGVVWAEHVGPGRGATERLVLIGARRLGEWSDAGELLSALSAPGPTDQELAGSLRFGVGPAVPGLARLPDSWAGARTALRVALRQPETGGVPSPARWDDLGALQLLRVLASDDLRRTVLSGPAGAFALGADETLVRTARTYLDEACSPGRTAAALTIHRQTLYHRLRQIEAATGLDLTRGQDRLTLHLALSFSDYLTA
ncbi:hypothetical protein E8D34_08180 [Nocardioides sp. GY 10113]|uniref:PucR family transcriptional regulator n=1 Tax=Nocardioides sp. GY 10113 TaxID=2569761 RepID=UPI0010A93E5C|nr:helix-turn-helix domain-containing protein [Nocardioides sp. GY 10113]TIC87654.1 hypothetical protein E8D34_08180 [Nocardioides sp. GY 10113]